MIHTVHKSAGKRQGKGLVTMGLQQKTHSKGMGHTSYPCLHNNPGFPYGLYEQSQVHVCFCI
jgi:hypothetical protein